MFFLISAKNMPENMKLLVLLLLYWNKGAARTRNITGGSSHLNLMTLLFYVGQW